MSKQTKWGYRTLIAPAWAVEQLQKEERSDDRLGNIIELDLRGESEIGVALYNLGLEGWELAATELVEGLGEYPGQELILFFKRPLEKSIS